MRGASALEHGPDESGVFARFSDDGATLELLDEHGHPVRRVHRGDGVGLVFALQPRANELAWVVTALDDAGARGGRARARRRQAARRVRRGGNWRQGGEAAGGGRMSLVPVYRSRPSALHAARAGAGAALCGALALTGALYLHPLILSAALGAIVLAGVLAGVGREIGRSLRFALPFALLIAVINPLVYPEGDTLLFRGGEVLGREIDITLEATAAGVFNGLRVIVIVTGVRPDVGRGRPGRAAADVPARVVPLGAHGDAGHPARAGARARRQPDERRRALPPASAGPAGGGARRAGRARSTGRWTWRRRSRCAATRSAGERARPPRPWSRHDWRVAGGGGGAGGGLGGRCGGRAWGRSSRIRRCRSRRGAPRSRSARWCCFCRSTPVRRTRQRGWGWRVAESLVVADGFWLPVSGGWRGVAVRHCIDGRARARSRSSRAFRARGSRRCCARSRAWFLTSTAARLPAS